MQMKGEHTEQEIETIVQYWWRMCHMRKIGWIKEFNGIIVDFL